VVAAVARSAFWAVIVLSPFRLRWILASHDVPPVWHDYTDLRVFAVDLALAALLVAWAASLLAGGRRPARIPVLVAGPGLALLGLIWAGVPGSLDPALSLAGVLELTAFAGLAWYIATELRTPRELALPAALMVALQSIVAIAQVAVQGAVGLGSLAEIALDPAASGIGIVESEAGVRLLRGYGLSDHPNILGGLLAVGLIVIVGGLASGAGTGGGRPSRRILSVAAGLGVVALAVTFSRAAWIAAAAAALAAAALETRLRASPGDRPGGLRAARPWLVLAGGVTLAVAALAVPFAPFLAARLGIAATPPTAEIRSIDERAWLAGAAVQVAADNPLLGRGLGTLPQAMATSPEVPYRPQPAHLVPLTVAAENGIPAALAFCLLLGGAVATAISRARQGAILPGAAAMALGLLTAIVVVSGLDYYPWVFPAGRTWLAVAIGTAMGLAGAPPSTTTGHESG
jgi:hypothetical protein